MISYFKYFPVNNPKIMQDFKSELQIQRDICVEVWNTLPETRHCLYHIKNELENKLTLAELIKLSQQKASGLLPGIQDLHFLWNGITYRIELKDGQANPEQKVSKAQRVIHAAHARQGSLTWLFNDSALCVAFITFIVYNSHTDYFCTPLLKTHFPFSISPFARPEMYETYLNEYAEEQQRKKAKRVKATGRIR